MAVEVAMSNLTPLERRYLSLAQASAVVNLSTRTLRRAIKGRRLRAHRLGRLTRIDLFELRRWVEADGAAPTPIRKPSRV